MICFQSAIQFFLQFFADWNGLWNGRNAVPDVFDHLNPFGNAQFEYVSCPRSHRTLLSSLNIFSSASLIFTANDRRKIMAVPIFPFPYFLLFLRTLRFIKEFQIAMERILEMIAAPLQLCNILLEKQRVHPCLNYNWNFHRYFVYTS